MITLTIAEIGDLAGYAGFVLNTRFLPDEDQLESEITITKCPAEGVREEGVPGSEKRFAHVAYFSEYPEEGVRPLGPELKGPTP